MTTTVHPVRNTYRSREVAARAWGDRHGVTGRTGGYLGTKTFTEYDALPTWLRANPAGRRRDPESLAGGRAAVKFMLFGPGWGSDSRHRAVHGWSSLADILVWRNQLRLVETVQGRRWALPEEN